MEIGAIYRYAQQKQQNEKTWKNKNKKSEGRRCVA